MEHVQYKHVNCDLPYCQFCHGGLFSCVVCTGGEGSLPDDCPGVPMTHWAQDEVYAGRLNFRDGQWHHEPSGIWPTALKLENRSMKMSGMNELSTNGAGLPATTGADPFSTYGAKVGTQGTFLTFKAGEFLAGQDSREIPIGTHMVANMEGLRIGWRRWKNDQLTDDLTEPLVAMQPMKRRDELGDNDQALWDRDDRGIERDPWQLTNVLEMVDNEGETYIYATGSKGGVGAIGRLCKEYGKLYRQMPGKSPVIELGRDSYMHKEYGKTYFPVFTIVAWVAADAREPDDDVPFGGSIGFGRVASKPPAAAAVKRGTRF